MKKSILLYSLICLFSCSNLFAASQDKYAQYYTAKFDSLFLEALYYKTKPELADSAIARFTTCHEINPYSASICYELSQLYLQQNNKVLGQAFLEQAVELNVENYFYQDKLAEFYFENDMLKQAADVYENITELFPEKDNVYYSLSIAYTKAEKYRKSIATLNKLEKRIGVTKIISVEKARLYMLDQNNAKALKELKILTTRYPIDATIWVYKGDLELQMGETDDALKSYKESLRMSPNNGAAIASLCGYYDRIGDKENTEKYLYKIFAAQDIEFTEKLRYLQNVYGYYQNEPDFANRLDSIYNTMIVADKNNAQIYKLYGDFLYASKQIEKAKQNHETATLLDANCYECWLSRFEVAYTNKDTIEAANVLSQAIEALPKRIEFYYFAAIIKYEEDKKIEAIEFVEKAEKLIDKETNSDIVDFVYQGLSEYELLIKKDTASAIAYAEKNLELNKTSVWNQNSLAYLYAICDINLDKAEKISAETIEKEPLNSYFLDTYAYILMKQNKLTLALFYIEQALEYDKENNFEIKDHYGDILYRLDRKQDACKVWNEAMEFAKNEQLFFLYAKTKKNCK